MGQKYVVTSPSFSKNKILADEVKKYFSEIWLNTEGHHLHGESLIEKLKNAEAAIIGTEKIDATILDYCPSLKLISKYGVGLDNLDLVELNKRNIKVEWATGANKTSVAEQSLAFMICLIRNLYQTSIQLKQGVWNKNGGRQLSHKTIGIIGLGNVGKELVRFLAPFECKILCNDIVDQAQFCLQNQIQQVSLETLLREADVVSVHVPLNEATHHLINNNTFKLMNSSSFLINTARGKIVDQEALKWALVEGIIAGAAIDVYDQEPLALESWHGISNLFCTPHIGGNAEEAVLAMGMAAIDILKKYLSYS